MANTPQESFRVVSALGNIQEAVRNVLEKVAGNDIASRSPEHISEDITASLGRALKTKGVL